MTDSSSVYDGGSLELMILGPNRHGGTKVHAVTRRGAVGVATGEWVAYAANLPIGLEVAEGALWAWGVGGVIGLASHCAGLPDVWEQL
jgi:threonine/homoserine efflux transporter RhtA